MPRSSSSLWVAVLLACHLALGIAAAAPSATPDNIRLTWSGDPRTTQTIGWRTDVTVTTGKVEYSGSGRRLLSIMAPPPEMLVTNVGAINLHSVTLRNLKPGTRYRYRVGDGAHWSAYYSFETEKAQAERFEFIVFGDSHEKKGSYKVWRAIANQAYRQNAGARFVMSLGDLIYAGKDYTQWETWFAGCQDVIANVPVVPVIGDHEPRGVSSDDSHERPEYFVKLFRVPQNGPKGFEGEVYSFDYGPVHIAVLNSSFTYEFADPEARRAMMEAEAAWLDADLAASPKRWKIVAYHDATYNLSADRAGTLTKQAFSPIIDKHHVDVVLNAHEHAMARSYFIRNEDFVPSAAEGTVYYISGRSGDNAKDDLGRKIWHPFFYDAQAQACYLVVGVEGGRMTITARLQDGTVIDRLCIDKERPQESTPVVPFGAYKSVRFAAFGYLFQSGLPPERNAAGEWFVDIGSLASYMTGTFDAATGVLSYNEGEIQLRLSDDMFLDRSKRMVSLTGLRSVGFRCAYREATNIVWVERWRD